MSAHAPICIVDALSTGRGLAAEFARNGMPCVHLRSTQRENRPGEIGHFVLEIDFDGDLAATASRLQALRVQHVVPGCELGVRLADALASHMALASSNAPELSLARTSKYEMHQQVRRHGLPVPEQALVSSKADAERWALSSRRWPVVLKPLDSASSDGVTICENIDELGRAFDDTIGKRNHLGRANDRLLIQEFLDGTQYFVNSVSLGGRHYLTDCWVHQRRRRPNGAYLFEAMSLVSWPQIVGLGMDQYATRMLDALGIRNGAAHTELMLTADGIRLIETGARLMGASIDGDSFKRVLGHTQLELLVQSYAQPKRFLAYARKPYRKQCELAEISFIFPTAGRLERFKKRQAIERLASFFSFVGVPAESTIVQETKDTLGLPGFCYLMHDDRDQLSADMHQILRWQRDGEIFELTPMELRS